MENTPTLIYLSITEVCYVEDQLHNQPSSLMRVGLLLRIRSAQLFGVAGI